MVKVLIVDDSTFMRGILIGILRKIGYTDTIEAENGEEAVKKFKKEKPNHILFLNFEFLAC